jgi:post-segregation antitoxin (ccd killing protein)
MRMARVNVYLPDDLAAAAKAADLNVSSLTQDALRKALAAANLNRWLADLDSIDSVEVDRASVEAAVAAAKDEVAGL